MNSGTESCIAAYVIGLGLMLGYAAIVWLACRNRRAVRQPPPVPQLRPTVVIGARRPSRTGSA